MPSTAPSRAWADDHLVSALQLVADSTTAVAGLAGMAISLVGDDEPRVVAVSGTIGSDEDVQVPLTDARGRLKAVLTIHCGGSAVDDLDRYAERAGRAVLTALERARLVASLQTAQAARQVIRETSRLTGQEELIRQCAPAVMAGLSAAGLWWRMGESPDHPDGEAIWADGRESSLSRGLGPHVTLTAERLWSDGEVLIAGPGQLRGEWDPAAARLATEYAEQEGLGSVMVVAIGWRRECLGAMVLCRERGDPRWTATEIRAARLLASDLGRAMRTSMELERERSVVQELRSLDRARSTLLRTVAHELKSPLTAILSNAELLDEEAFEPGLVEQAVRRIRRGSDRMGRLIDDLTTYSAAGEEMQEMPVDLAAVVRDVCDLLLATAGRRDQRLTMQVPDEAVEVTGDPALLERLVVNLVGNALKYTHDGGRVSVAVSRVVVHGRDLVELTVADDGIGIAPNDEARLFSEFFRSTDPRVREQSGTGLGLAIVARIVARHHGTVEVDSEHGAGSTFRVRLPGAR